MRKKREKKKKGKERRRGRGNKVISINCVLIDGCCLVVKYKV